MAEQPNNPFDSLESAHEYVCLLQEALEEARQAIETDTEIAGAEGADRRVQALRVVSYKLSSLAAHMHASRRLLNDLRTLRRMLLGERQGSLAEAGSSMDDD